MHPIDAAGRSGWSFSASWSLAPAAGGYTKLGALHKISGAFPGVPLLLENQVTLEQYDQDDFGFLRLELSKKEILGTYVSAPYVSGSTPAAKVVESFRINIRAHTVRTTSR